MPVTRRMCSPSRRMCSPTALDAHSWLHRQAASTAGEQYLEPETASWRLAGTGLIGVKGLTPQWLDPE